jgi:pilus assembly protein CpaF
MAMMSDVEIPLVALRLQIASGVNVIVQVARLQDGTRKLSHITEVIGFDTETGKYQLSDIFVRKYSGVDSSGRIQSDLIPSGRLPTFQAQLAEHGLELPRAIYDAAQRGAERS